MSRDAVTEAVMAMLDETGTRMAFAVALAAELDWTMDDAESVRRVRQMFNGGAHRHLPARAVPIAVRVSGLDYVTPILQREAIKAELRAEEEGVERPGVRPVRRSDRLRDVG